MTHLPVVYCTRSIIAAAGLALTASCIGEPFGYAEDRCVGAYNQCQTACTGIESGPARAACTDRCFTQENRCYGTGDDSASSLAVDRAIGEKRTQAEKEADFQRWKAKKERESAQAETAEEEE